MTDTPVAPKGPVYEIGWGEDPVDIYRKLRFAMRAGQRGRVAVLDSAVNKTFVHYAGFYFYHLEEDCPFCLVKQPAPRYLTWVLVYNVDADGKIIDTPLGGVIKAWMFGRDKYSVLAATAEEWGDLRTVDLLIECTDEKYQRMSITAARECLWQADETFSKQVIKMLQEAKIDPTELMARSIPREQIIALAKGDQAPSTTTTEAPELEEAVEALSAVAPASENLKNLLDQLD